ncbi:4Fe-4S binding domain-containing protein [Selenomonas ruminantium]|uniref:4Fe-4S binding domain-containing protein n=1 Tax=Selenomonas ruminantium TaxID=971 RepID=A0A1M6XJT7_SELRU|nr:4Fe-4S binding protein [Selenomonas ruminantium]SHL06221.1 4Fe-4S binding domain-containing protein [Selenomonas ruminantium]
MCKKNRRAMVRKDDCVACGTCADVCPRGAITIQWGSFAQVDRDLCVGCGRCVRECPAAVITLEVGA